MSTTRRFHLGDILSVTTERLVGPNHVGGLYDVLNWMTGDNLFTHQLPRAMREVAPELLAQHPQLGNVVVPDEFPDPAQQTVAAWLAEQVAIYGETLPLTPLNPADHIHIDPVAELKMLRPDMRVLVIDPSTGEMDEA